MHLTVKKMTVSEELFEIALKKIKNDYPTYRFMVHRDVAWTLQKIFHPLLKDKGYPLEVYQDYLLPKGRKEHKDYELIFVSQGTNYREWFKPSAQVEAVIHILFEPSKYRRDICEHHLLHIVASELGSHLSDLKLLVDTKKPKEAILMIVDEYSRHQEEVRQFENSQWEQLGTYRDPGLNVSIGTIHYGH